MNDLIREIENADSIAFTVDAPSRNMNTSANS